MSVTGAQPAITFDTNGGKVTLEIRGNDLLILEGYDGTVAEKAREVLLHGMALPQPAAKSSNK
jgi:hypothetical protein